MLLSYVVKITPHITRLPDVHNQKNTLKVILRLIEHIESLINIYWLAQNYIA